MNDLASVLQENGKLIEAEPMFKQTLQLKQKVTFFSWVNID